jgi:hypothetical protein
VRDIAPGGCGTLCARATLIVLLPAAEKATTLPIAVHRYDIGQLFWLFLFGFCAAFFPAVLIPGFIPFFSLNRFQRIGFNE